MTKKLTIINMAGNNLGDNAILAGMIKKFSQHHHLISCIVPDPQIARDSIEYTNLTWINLKNPINSIIEVVRSEHIVFGGGGIITDDSNWRDLYVLSLLLIGYITGADIQVYSLGVDIPKNKLVKILFRYIAKISKSITVRDKESKKRVKIMTGISPTILPDPAFVYLEEADTTRTNLSKSNFNNITLCVNFRYIYKFGKGLNQEFLPNKAAKIITYILEYFKNAYIEFIPIGIGTKEYSNDVLFARNMIRYLTPDIRARVHIRDDTKKPHEILKILKECDGLLGMRLHSIIFATKLRKPFLAISYDQKVYDFLKMVELEKFSISPQEKPEKIAKKMILILENKHRIRWKGVDNIEARYLKDI